MVSRNMNVLADSGHHVWVFSVRRASAALKAHDHEGIRVNICPDLFFRAAVLFKFWERRDKKKIDLALVPDPGLMAVFGDALAKTGVDCMCDSDMSLVFRRIKQISFR
jgi:hypothetical protein